MREDERRSAAVFRAVCLGFSALLLVLTLFCQIRLSRTREAIWQLEKDLCAEKSEALFLQAERERSLSLEELERRAVLELGMQHPEPGQIIMMENAG